MIPRLMIPMRQSSKMSMSFRAGISLFPILIERAQRLIRSMA